ncbi:hypothetical protein J4526_00820 [Desulfurococcaceae archaeon MEX13E-LK6-19]|nr:hypothetical protein J4526_00820 [Desulfurococcaceae archaeon MEX13E-LK6-19]
MSDISLLEKLIPSSVVARISMVDNKLVFDVTIGFRDAIDGEKCLWLNPGLVVKEVLTQSPFELKSTLTKDPDVGVVDVNRVDILLRQPVYGIRIKYEGLLKPLLISHWGSRDKLHIGRAETLWYPFTMACKNIVESLILCEHVISVMRFKLRDGLVAIASLEFQGIEDGEWIYTSGYKTSALEFIIGPFAKTEYSGRKTVYSYIVGEQMYPSKQLYDVIEEIEGLYKEVYGVEPPYSQYHIVFLDKTGGYKAGTLIALDKEYVKTIDALKANLIHELSHTWWGGFIKPCSSDSTWLTEAIPEYITTVLLDKLKIRKLKDRVKKIMKQAKELMKQKGYKPPTKIPMPLTDVEEKSWRIVGETILHEIAKEIGYDTLNSILSNHMRKSMEEQKRYCITWKQLLQEIASVSKKVEKKIEKYLQQ